MAKKTAAELNLKAEVIEGPKNMEELPDEYTPGPPPPYPGSYRFKLPSNLSALWDTFDTKITEGGPEVQRVSLIFDKEDPLVIEAAPPSEKDLVGTPFTVRVNNRERNRAKKSDPPLFVSDLTYLLRALGEKTTPKTNQEFITATLKYAGRSFGADVEWSTNCNEEKQIYIEVPKTDAQGNQLVDPATGAAMTELAPGVDPATQQPVKGCGKRYYMNNWPKGGDGRYLPRMRCECGASLRPFGQLRNFRA